MELLTNVLLQFRAKRNEISSKDLNSILVQTLDQMTPIITSIKQDSLKGLTSDTSEASVFVRDAYGLLGTVMDVMYGYFQDVVQLTSVEDTLPASVYMSIGVSTLSVMNGVFLTTAQSIVNIIVSIILSTKTADKLTQKAYTEKIRNLKEDTLLQLSTLSETLFENKANIANDDSIGLSEVLMNTESKLDGILLQYSAFLDSSVSMHEAVISADTISEDVYAVAANISYDVVSTSKLKLIS